MPTWADMMQSRARRLRSELPARQRRSRDLYAAASALVYLGMFDAAAELQNIARVRSTTDRFDFRTTLIRNQIDR